MAPSKRETPDFSEGQAVIETLLRTALWLFDVTAALLDDLPEDAFPGEDSGAVMIEMLAGSCRPAIDAAGREGCQVTIELADAIRENIRKDLQIAAESRRSKQVLL